MKTAQDWGKPPSFYLCDPFPPTPESVRRDKMIQIAYTLYKEELCNHCGYPMSICRNEERFEAKQVHCFAKAAVETAQRDYNAGLKKDEHDDGSVFIPIYKPLSEVK